MNVKHLKHKVKNDYESELYVAKSVNNIKFVSIICHNFSTQFRNISSFLFTVIHFYLLFC